MTQPAHPVQRPEVTTSSYRCFQESFSGGIRGVCHGATDRAKRPRSGGPRGIHWRDGRRAPAAAAGIGAARVRSTGRAAGPAARGTAATSRVRAAATTPPRPRRLATARAAASAPPAYGAPAYGQPAPAYAPPGYVDGPRSEGLAVAALVVAIVGVFVCGVFAGIVALVLASQAQQKINASNGQLTGAGMVTAARVIGIMAIALNIIIIAVFIGTS